MGTTVPPAIPPRPARNTARWSGIAYSSRQPGLNCSPLHHLGAHRVGDGRPTVEMEAVWPWIYTIKLSILILVQLTLTLIQDHRSARRQKVLRQLSQKVFKLV